MPVKDYNLDPDLNTTISGINIAEGCAPSGINDAIRQLMADVKEESEAQTLAEAQSAAKITQETDTKISTLNTTLRAVIGERHSEALAAVGETEESVSALEAALRALVAQEVAKCLKLTGGVMTGKVIGVSYEQMCPDIDHNVSPTANRYGSSIRFLAKNSTPLGVLIPIQRSDGALILRLSILGPDGVNGTHLDIGRNPNGTSALHVGGNSVLTSAGGTMLGNFTFDRDIIQLAHVSGRTSGYAIFNGGDGYGTGASFVAYGKDHATTPGRAYVRVTKTDPNNASSTISSQLTMDPGQPMTWGGSNVLTEGAGTAYAAVRTPNVAADVVAGNTFTLPSGGRWAYTYHRTDYSDNAGGSGIAAGGTTITAAEGPTAYFAIRIE